MSSVRHPALPDPDPLEYLDWLNQETKGDEGRSYPQPNNDEATTSSADYTQVVNVYC